MKNPDLTIQMSPLVSVLMPAYNCEPYIEKAISSILNQTHINLELIICDDGSSDLTWKAVNSFSDKRIRKFKNDKNLGYLETYNFLMSSVQGEYFTFQDADDWSILNRLEIQLNVFRKINDIEVCACNGTFYYSEEIQRRCPPFKSDYITLTEGNFHFMLPSIMYKSQVLNSYNKFNKYFDQTTGGDQYYILEVLTRFKGFAINDYLYVARFNPTSNHRTLTSKRKLVASDMYFLLKRQRVSTGSDWLLEGKHELLMEYQQRLLRDRRFLAEKYREYAVYKIDSNQIVKGLMLAIASLTYWPFWIPTYRTLFYAFRQSLQIK